MGENIGQEKFLKVTKQLRKQYPHIAFGKVQRAWKCDRAIREKAPFEVGKIYSGGSPEEYWVCLESGENPDQALLQQILSW